MVKWLAVMTAAMLASCVASRAPIDREPPNAAGYDSTLFRATVLHLSAIERMEPLHVDPRPLPADPDIVTFHSLETVVPEWVRGQAIIDQAGDSLVIGKRIKVLAETGTPTTDAWKDAACPGVLIPPSPEILEWKRRDCPSKEFLSAVIAVPRAGGAYWPDNVDERNKHGAGTFTVRVITRSVSPDGSVEASYDYVYRCADSGECSLLEVKPLLIVE